MTSSFNSIARFHRSFMKEQQENIDQLREKKKKVEASLAVTFRRLTFLGLFQNPESFFSDKFVLFSSKVK